MNQLTIRGFDQVLSDTHKKKHCVGSTLDEFIGSWSDNEAKEFENDVAQLRQIDDEIWK